MSLINTTFQTSNRILKNINKLIVVTRGDKGAIAINKDEITECSALKIDHIKDLTGAGDLFASGFLHGFINKSQRKA